MSTILFVDPVCPRPYGASLDGQRVRGLGGTEFIAASQLFRDTKPVPGNTERHERGQATTAIGRVVVDIISAHELGLVG